MRAAIAAALVLIATVATAHSAQALTIRDVIELTRAGLTDDVLVALIEVDGGVYATDTATLKSLKASGVSERVMIALIRSGRDRRIEEALPAPAPVVDDPQLETAGVPAPQVVVIDHHEPQVQQVAVPVPVYVPVYMAGPSHRRDRSISLQESTFVPFQTGSVPIRSRPEPPAPPTYWGFGGKLRPDAWGQPQEHDARPADGSAKRDKGDKTGATRKEN